MNNMNNTKKELLWAMDEFPYWGELEEELSNPDAREIFLAIRIKMSQVLSNIEFELRVPQTSILGYLHALNESLNKKQLSEDQMNYLDEAEKSAGRNMEYILELTNGFLLNHKQKQKDQDLIEGIQKLSEYLRED